MDEVFYPGVIRGLADEEIASLLADPFGVRVGGAACDLDAARFMVDIEHDIDGDQAAGRPYFLSEEIRCPGDIEVTADKCLPVHTLAVGRSRQTVSPEDITDGSGGYGMPEFGHFARDPVVTPHIVAGQFDDDRLGVRRLRRSSGAGLAAVGEIPFRSLERSVPFEDGLGLEDQRTLGKAVFGSNASCGEQTALLIGQENALVADNAKERAHLCSEEFDFRAFPRAAHGAYACDKLLNSCDVIFHRGADDMRLQDARES